MNHIHDSEYCTKHAGGQAWLVSGCLTAVSAVLHVLAMAKDLIIQVMLYDLLQPHNAVEWPAVAQPISPITLPPVPYPKLLLAAPPAAASTAGA